MKRNPFKQLGATIPKHRTLPVVEATTEFDATAFDLNGVDWDLIKKTIPNGTYKQHSGTTMHEYTHTVEESKVFEKFTKYKESEDLQKVFKEIEGYTDLPAGKLTIITTNLRENLDPEIRKKIDNTYYKNMSGRSNKYKVHKINSLEDLAKVNYI